MTIKELQKKYTLDKDDFWEHKQSKQWIITHKAVEKIAEQEGIKLVNIEVLNSDVDLVRFIITMSEPNGGQVQTVGEADRSNCFSQYLGCMAEKRGVDRCVLKTINAYQYGIASEVEAEDFKRPQKESNSKIIEDEIEMLGKILEPEPQDAPKSPNIGLKCPLCNKGVVDQREEYVDGFRCKVSKKGKNLPAFKCIDNDDFNDPTCKYATWNVDEFEVSIEEAPHKLVEDDRYEEAVEVADDRPLAIR